MTKKLEMYLHSHLNFCLKNRQQTEQINSRMLNFISRLQIKRNPRKILINEIQLNIFFFQFRFRFLKTGIPLETNTYYKVNNVQG